MLKEKVQEHISAEVYLTQEEKAAVRHEFIDGKLFEMPGGTRFHEKVIMNMSSILYSLLRIKGFEIFAQGMRCSTSANRYYYPDILVTNETFSDVRFSRGPVLLVEVLSPSTRSFDTVDKFIDYRSMPSLEYYLLAEPDYCHVTLNYKTPEGEWMAEVFNKKSAIIALSKLDIMLPLEDVYFGLDWE